jgi:choline dehydrogenase-like flavoprotein
MVTQLKSVDVAVIGLGAAGGVAVLPLTRAGLKVAGIEATHLPTVAPEWAIIRETNVVNRWGFSHEIPNLGILGASVTGTSGARNPTLIARALGWRTADHLAKNWKSFQ